MTLNDILVGLRIHRKQASKDEAVLVKMLKLLEERVKEYLAMDSLTVGIAFDAQDEELYRQVNQIHAKYSSKSSPGKLLLAPVHVWAQYTPALNSLLVLACESKMKHILFLSLEVQTTHQEIRSFQSLLLPDPNILMAGKALPGHDFKSGQKVQISGLTCAWNTFAMWNVAELAKTGFLMVSDGYVEGVGWAIEEPTVVALQMKLNPKVRCLLVDSRSSGLGNDGGWNVQLDDPKRAEYHREKMASKNLRCKQQLTALNLAGQEEFFIEHVSLL